MFRRIFTVAFNAYREAVRARILLGLSGIAFAVASYSLIVGAYTLREAARVVADLGAAAVSVFSILVAVVIGATSLYRELEMKTIMPLLARPIQRWEYLVGKYLGIMLVVLVFVLAESGLVLTMSSFVGEEDPVMVVGSFFACVAVLVVAVLRFPGVRTVAPIPFALALAAIGYALAGIAPLERSLVVTSASLTFLEVMIVAAIAMLFSSFSTPFLSAVLTVMLFVIGRSADSLATLPVRMFGETVRTLGQLLAKVVPNLHIYVPERPLLTGEALEADIAGYLALAGLQALAWTVLLLTIASLIFQRRDFV